MLTSLTLMDEALSPDLWRVPGICISNVMSYSRKGDFQWGEMEIQDTDKQGTVSNCVQREGGSWFHILPQPPPQHGNRAAGLPGRDASCRNCCWGSEASDFLAAFTKSRRELAACALNSGPWDITGIGRGCASG